MWVLDVASGQTKVVGSDPWMVPERTLNPVVEPRFEVGRVREPAAIALPRDLRRNVETGEAKQVTDGLADAVWPAWDASGKYLWFLASTDFGLRSQWLDMTSYDHTENFGLYLAVLKKGEPTPLLPESDEDRGRRHRHAEQAVAALRQARGEAAAPADADDSRERTGRACRPARRARRSRCQIDFDGLPQRILAIPGVPAREYSRLRAGARRHRVLSRSRRRRRTAAAPVAAAAR